MDNWIWMPGNEQRDAKILRRGDSKWTHAIVLPSNGQWTVETWDYTQDEFIMHSERYDTADQAQAVALALVLLDGGYLGRSKVA